MPHLSLRKSSVRNEQAQHGNRRAGGGGGTVSAQPQKVDGFGRIALHGGNTGPILPEIKRRSLDRGSAVRLQSEVEPLECELEAILQFPVAAPNLQGRHASEASYCALSSYKSAWVCRTA